MPHIGPIGIGDHTQRLKVPLRWKKAFEQQLREGAWLPLVFRSSKGYVGDCALPSAMRAQQTDCKACVALFDLLMTF
eukprot:scaffold159833_cov40-Prasinocladus_malaysianus.AAC.2